jgi:3-methyl-2-oxobutanoate hydroxymethyltransferase
LLGIGAGAATDGQVLVWHDLLGIYSGHKPKFVKRFASLRDEMLAGVSSYTEQVRSRAFPTEEYSYSIDPEELAEFHTYLEEESLSAQTKWDW